MLRPALVLTTICILAALVLGITYNITKPLIAAQEEKEESLALRKVLVGIDEYKQESLDGREYYEGYQRGRLVGYALFAEGDGYAGKIQMLVGIDTKGKIIGLEVLSQQETPGLGARCIEIRPGEDQPWFLRQFKGKSASGFELGDIDAITGATITSEAIVESVNEAVVEFLESTK